MRITHDGEIVRTDIWREGKYLDLWSVPHFLSGIVLGIALHLLDFDVRSAIVIGLLLLIAYEMFEVIAKIEETPMNRTLDVVVGMSSLVPTLFFVSSLSFTQTMIVLVSTGAVDGVLSFLGWRASHKAAVLEERLRVEYVRERARLRERSAFMRSRWRERREKWRKRRNLEPSDVRGENHKD